jgi:putative membrane protein
VTVPDLAHGSGVASGITVAFRLAVTCLLAAYLIGAAHERRGRRGWSTARLASFTAGVGLILGALSPQLSAWAHHDLRGHMLQHLLLGMLAPLALVLGAPGTLLLRRMPIRTARRMSAAMRSTPVARLTHPATALALDTGGLYLLYLTPVYALSQVHPLLSTFLHIHFLGAGCLFAWAIVGPDPAPHRPRLRVRLAVLFVAIAAHSTLAKVLYAYGMPTGAGFDAAVIRDAAQIMYYGGDIAELLLAIALFASWYRRAHSAAPPGGCRPTTIAPATDTFLYLPTPTSATTDDGNRSRRHLRYGRGRSRIPARCLRAGRRGDAAACAAHTGIP